MSRAIAGGSSGTSDSPMMFVLLQFGLMGPLLVPLWAFGLWRLWCDTRRRAFAVAYAVLFVTFAVSGGKAYYLGGITVGIDRDHLTHYFADIRPAGRIDNGFGIANDEQGQPLFVCRALNDLDGQENWWQSDAIRRTCRNEDLSRPVASVLNTKGDVMVIRMIDQLVFGIVNLMTMLFVP
jgi:hypothetical protein